MTILRGFAPYPVATKTKSMDELIKGFFSNSLTNDEYRQLYENMKGKKTSTYPDIYKQPEVKVPESEQVEHVSLTDYSGSITFESGMTLTLNKNGDMSATYDGKQVEVDSQLILKVPASTLQYVYNHVIKLHMKDNAIAQSKILAEKTRYIHTGNKRAFVAGMLTGQKLKTP